MVGRRKIWSPMQKLPVGAFNQEKALVGAFSVIVKTDCKTEGLFAPFLKKMSVHAAMASCVNIWQWVNFAGGGAIDILL